MAQKHALLTAVHRPYAAVYADATARLAATGFVRELGGGIVAFAAEDLYKKALQLNTATEWILTAITPTWVQIGGGGLTPTAHATSHQNSGSDEINVAGLSGLLADPQTPLTENVQDIAGAMLTDSATIDFSYNDGAGTATASILAAGVRSVLLDMQRWAINFTDNGDAYIAADVAMTIDAGVAAIGTGTLAYEKSTAAAPGTFSSTTLPASLEAGAWLKVTVSALSGFKAVELKRTA